VLFVVDFSGSMARKEDEYKKALISGLEALNRLSIKTGLFAFAETEGTQTYYVVKALEEPKWTQRHAAKLAALEAGGQTPTPIMYEKLKKYIRKTRPHITVTVTDGKPNRYFPGEDPEEATRRLVKELKRDTRMVAFGIEEDSRALANQLKSFGYHQITAVPDLRKLPNEFVKLIAPEIKVAT
jgi:Mg-chelatase subunit ChlD